MSIGAVLRFKGSDIFATSEDASYQDVADKLSEHDVGALIVRDAAGALAGIISERDLTRAHTVHRGNVAGLRVRDMMTRKVNVCSSDNTLVQALNFMLQNHHRHLVVVDDGKISGIVSLGDLVRFRLKAINLLFEDLGDEFDDDTKLGAFTKHLSGRIRAKSLEPD